jgi:cobalt/nickel transport system permease protein
MVPGGLFPGTKRTAVPMTFDGDSIGKIGPAVIAGEENMHISEGVLAWQVLAGGGAMALAGTTVGTLKMDQEKIARTGILSAAFFVASLIHIPIGPSSMHLILNGLVGIILGWSAFPAILIALLLQAILFQYGGLTTLGVNTVIMAAPAVVCFYFFRLFAPWPFLQFAAAFMSGVLAILLCAVLAAAALYLSEKNFLELSLMIMAAHVPVMIVEGLISGFAVVFLRKVKPGLLA